ncbi:DegT/DnrJ/EryC1/StrS family aminotransferase [Pseudalkalibacillus sp. SCS-8]|uniref:DegT/DnrJ/EryC1/StrS family aminotransferase n=1 Tax=Pseudalkalibacillus nanhaiensis TaxID=3115291 RepID=UPI0032DAB213
MSVRDKEKIFLSPPHMTGNEMEYVQEAFNSNWIAPLGPNVDAFEKGIAEYVGAKGALAVSSGTAAIHLALSLLGIGEGDTVLCSTLTFVASANPILYLGAEPVFVDSEPDSWNMSPAALEKAIREEMKRGKIPKAIIVVHIYGLVADMDKICEISKRYGIPIIEDAAESLGSTYKGRQSGSIGDFGIYSFNGNKIITTSGGGMLVSNDIESIERARFLSTQARDPAIHYQHSQVGYNYRMSNILAGIGLSQLKVIKERIKQKRTVFERYVHGFQGIPEITFMPELEQTYSNRWLTTILLQPSRGPGSPSYILNKLRDEQIEARPIWKPLHLQPLFKKMRFYTHFNDKSVAEGIYANGLCLPSGSNLSLIQQRRVIDCILGCFMLRVKSG